MKLLKLHPDLTPIVDRCLESFRRWAGHEPEAMAAAPGRVNLIGEHTDYNDGFVLPMAINRWCVAAGSVVCAGETSRGGEKGRVLSDQMGQEVSYAPNSPDVTTLESASWARYPVGVLWCLRPHALRPPSKGVALAPRRPWAGTDLALNSSVPLGAGLSSSAAVEVATARLADHLFGIGLGPETIAQVARQAEHQYAGVPCGIMDQMISAAGGIQLIDCRTMLTRHIRISEPAEVAVVVAHSGVRHALASGEYAQRRASCQRAAAVLGVAALRDADPTTLARHQRDLTASDHACARHVITENTRVQDFILAVARDDLGAAGQLMYESHRSLRDDYRVSCSELDALVDAARATPGVYGSRMTGGGFGGCTVTLCRADAAARVCEALHDAALAVGRPPVPPFVATPVAGAAAWSVI